MIAYWIEGQAPAGYLLKVEPQKLTVCAYSDRGGDGPELTDGAAISPQLEGKKCFVSKPGEFALEDLRNRREWEDYSMWGLPLDPRNLVFRQPLNINAIANVNRVSPNWFHSIADTEIPVRFYVPHRDADFTEMAIEVSVTQGFPLSANHDAVELPPFELSRRMLPKIDIEGPETISAGATAQFGLRARHADGSPYLPRLVPHLRVSAGIPSKNWFALKDGVGHFHITAAHLEAGDEIEIIAGFRYTYMVTRKLVAVI